MDQERETRIRAERELKGTKDRRAVSKGEEWTERMEGLQ
jgi:hypothetical protein